MLFSGPRKAGDTFLAQHVHSEVLLRLLGDVRQKGCDQRSQLVQFTESMTKCQTTLPTPPFVQNRNGVLSRSELPALVKRTAFAASGAAAADPLFLMAITAAALHFEGNTASTRAAFSRTTVCLSASERPSTSRYKSGPTKLNSGITGNSAYFELLGASPAQRSFHHEVEEEGPVQE